MQDFAGDEARTFKEEHGLDDLVDFSHPPNRVQLGEMVIHFRPVHRRLGRSWRYRVDADSPACEFDGKRLRRCVQATLGQSCQR